VKKSCEFITYWRDFLLAILITVSTSDGYTLMNAAMHLKGKYTGLLKKWFHLKCTIR